jgi:HAD superfamily hydrolase (TIGR01549 family)
MSSPNSLSSPNYFRPYLGVIYDLDGTLLQSPQDYPAMRRMVIDLAHRAGLPPGELNVHMTIPHLLGFTRDRMQQLGLPPGMYLRFEAEVNRRLDALELEALPGVRSSPDALEHLTRMHASGYRLGVLTRSSEAFARQALHQTGMLPLLDRLRTRSDSGPIKPDPESLRVLLADLGVPRDRAVFVGDMPADLECASGAAVDFVALVLEGPNAAAREEEMRRKGARRLSHSFRELHRELTGAAMDPAHPGASPPR